SAMSASNHGRDAAIKQLHECDTTISEIARRFGVMRGRVQQIVTREEFRASHRTTMIARYGTNPNLSRLPDDTPLEVMTLCDGKVQAWATRLMHLPFANPSIKTLGDLRRASNTQLLAVDGVGKK